MTQVLGPEVVGEARAPRVWEAGVGVLVMACAGAGARVHQDCCEVVAEIGDLLVFDLAHEVRLCDADIVHWVVIPPCLIGPWLADGRLSTPGLRLPTSDLMVSLAAQGVMSVVAHHDSVEQANTGLVLSALARLVGAAIAQGTPGVEQLGADGELRAQIIQHLDWAVRYGRVRPVDVAQRFDISVRKLHLLFECEELSFSQTAMSIRARLCALDLQCSDDVTGDIARRWGFADSSHLARTMRRHLGCTPAQVRGRAAWTV